MIKKINFLAIFLTLLCLCKVYADGNDVTIRLVTDLAENHLQYVPIEFTSNAENVTIASINVSIDGDAKSLISQCDQAHCNYDAIGETSNMPMCSLTGSTELAHVGQSCYVWLTTKDIPQELPFSKQGVATIKAVANLKGGKVAQQSFAATVDYALYAAGKRTLYKYDGTQWKTLGQISGGYNQLNALAVYNGDLYIGGSYSSIGSMNTNNLAKWNGQQFIALNHNINGQINALGVQGGKLQIGGEFSGHFAKWDGNTIPVNTPQAIYGMADKLLATSYTGNSSGLIDNSANNVTISGMPVIAGLANNQAIIKFDNNYCTGGIADSSSGLASSALVCFNAGANFNYIANQYFYGSNYCSGSKTSINVLDYNPTTNTIIAGGCAYQAYKNGKKIPVFNIAYSNTSDIQPGSSNQTWNAVHDTGVNKQVYALAHSGKYEFVGGEFDSLCEKSSAGGCISQPNSLQYITYFTLGSTGSWESLKTAGSPPHEPIHALTILPSLSLSPV